MAFAEEMTVKTEKGTVRGIRVDHDFGQYYYSFRGIRYAQAPTGKLRFKVCMYIIFLGNKTHVGLVSHSFGLISCGFLICTVLQFSSSSTKVLLYQLVPHVRCLMRFVVLDNLLSSPKN